MRKTFTIILMSLNACCFAGEIESTNENGINVLSLRQGGTRVKLAPTAGANAFSINVGGIEYLRQPESLENLPGVGFGTPVLYPTPNRVKDAAFVFEGKEVRFEPNAGGNFIHGLVNRHIWKIVSTKTDVTSASVRCVADFRTGSELHERFPFSHQLYLSLHVSEKKVRWTYEVDNAAGEQNIPFGFALHPYFVYQGERKSTFLTIPATHWMESEKQLPSGKLIASDRLDFPLGKPMTLQGKRFDDVFWGLKPQNPTIIEFRDEQRNVVIQTSDEFTHLVVWTPDRPYFGIESQTCSTDAHNLYAQGNVDAAHLQICPPGASMSGWVEYQFTGSKPPVAANELPASNERNETTK